MTIGFNGLGNSGRLGNQLFQYASLRGIAANRGFDFVFPPPYDSIDNYGVHECFKLDGIKEENVAFLNTQQGVQEAHFHFDENLYNNCPDNVNLLGCYQTEKYFKEIEDVIRNDLQFQDEILKPCEEMMSGFDTRPIMLHVRRGDPHHVIDGARHGHAFHDLRPFLDKLLEFCEVLLAGQRQFHACHDLKAEAKCVAVKQGDAALDNASFLHALDAAPAGG